MISFVMPAKNAQKYIGDAILALQESVRKEWELIVVEDHSDDETFQLVESFAAADCRIRVFQNPGKGKVQGLNFGFSKTNADYIKCIDADDVLLEGFWTAFDRYKTADTFCHACHVTDEHLKVLDRYNLDRSIVVQNFEYCLRNLKSIPRWSWTFTREIAEKIFPMPDDLPFEDVWFSIMIKRHAAAIEYVPEPAYLYRQHSNQTFGGILNANNEVVVFRARRILKLLTILCRELGQDVAGIEEMLQEIKTYQQMLASDNLTHYQVLSSSMSLNHKLKVLAYKKYPFAVPSLMRIKWFFDRQ